MTVRILGEDDKKVDFIRSHLHILERALDNTGIRLMNIACETMEEPEHQMNPFFDDGNLSHSVYFVA